THRRHAASHPDFYRRSWSSTRSTDSRGSRVADCHRRFRLSLTPENVLHSRATLAWVKSQERARGRQGLEEAVRSSVSPPKPRRSTSRVRSDTPQQHTGCCAGPNRQLWNTRPWHQGDRDAAPADQLRSPPHNGGFFVYSIDLWNT